MTHKDRLYQLEIDKLNKEIKSLRVSEEHWERKAKALDIKLSKAQAELKLWMGTGV
tara:strand:- start:2367 stop:2534 length:168 start_codon:yes stop_codon:yes gene_type:complete